MGQWAFGCQPFSEALIDSIHIHVKPWYLLSHVSTPYLIGTWILDQNASEIQNELNGSHRQPMLETSVGSTTTTWSSDHFQIVPGSKMSINVYTYANWEVTQVVYTLTTIVKIKILTLPSSGFETIIVFNGKRPVGLAVSSTGKLFITYKKSGDWVKHIDTAL